MKKTLSGVLFSLLLFSSVFSAFAEQSVEEKILTYIEDNIDEIYFQNISDIEMQNLEEEIALGILPEEDIVLPGEDIFDENDIDDKTTALENTPTNRGFEEIKKKLLDKNFQIKSIEDLQLQEEIRKILDTLARRTKDSDVLSFLSQNQHIGIRSTTAKNPDLSKDDQIRLMTDSESVVRSYLGVNPKLEKEVAEVLANDEEPMVRRVIAANSPHQDILKTFLEDKPEVQQKLGNNRTLSDELKILISEKSHEEAVVSLLRSHNSIPEEALKNIESNTSGVVQEALKEFYKRQSNNEEKEVDEENLKSSPDIVSLASIIGGAILFVLLLVFLRKKKK